MRAPKPYNRQTDTIERWAEQELNQYLRETFSTLNRGLQFRNNFLCEKIRVTIPANSMVTINNPLRRASGERIEPDSYWVFFETFHRQVSRGTVWSETALSFTNEHATEDTRCDILLGFFDDPVTADVIATEELTSTQGVKVSGPRAIFPLYENASITASQYLRLSNAFLCTSTIGYYMPKSGSVLGLSAQVNATVVTTPNPITIAVRKGGVALATAVSASIGTTGVKNVSSTYDSTSYRFEAGDILNIYLDFASFVGTLTNINSFAEVAFDA